jgi:hypothetical protein
MRACVRTRMDVFLVIASPDLPLKRPEDIGSLSDAPVRSSNV